MNECQLQLSDKQCKDVLKTSHLNPPCLQSCQVIWLMTTWGNGWNSRHHLWEKFLQTRCLELSPLVLTESWLWRISWLLWTYFITFMLESGSNHYTDMAQRVWSRLLWVLAWKEATFQWSLVSPLTWTHHLIGCPKFYLERHLVVPCYMSNLWKIISEFFQSLQLECS